MSGLNVADYNRQGMVFTAANVSAKSVIAVTTAMTGVILYNPPSSDKKLVIVGGGFAWTTAPAAVHNLGWALMTRNDALPTSLTAIGSGVLAADGTGAASTAQARAYDAATLPVAPIAVRWFGGAAYGSGVGESPNYMFDHVDGALVVVPGSALTLTVVTTTAVGLGSVTWIEVPE